MFNISSFLEKTFKNIQSADEEKEEILKIIKDLSGISLTKDSVEIKNGALLVNSSPAGKNKIALNKKVILEHTAFLHIKDIQFY